MFGKKKYPRWTWHSKWGLGYLSLGPPVPLSRKLDRTQKVEGTNGTLLIDFDDSGSIVGIEVIG